MPLLRLAAPDRPSARTPRHTPFPHRGARTAMRVLLTAVAAAGVVAVPATAAEAEFGAGVDAEHIASYDVDARVNRDGSMDVTETIDYDFGGAARHGVRRLLLRERGGGTFARRSFGYTDVAVKSTDAPDRVDSEDDGHRLTLTIGDPGTTVTGRHRYVVSYTVTGALDRAAGGGDGVELEWDFTGDGWQVPIDRADITVRTPVAATGVECGRGSATDNCDAKADGTSTTVTWTDAGSYSGTPMLLALPDGAVDAGALGTPSPYTPTWWGLALAGVLLLPLLAVPWIGLPRGGSASTSRSAPSVDHVPPAIALLLSRRGIGRGRAVRTAVAATLVDLAVRGHLRVQPVGDPGSARGWYLLPGELTGEPPGGKGRAGRSTAVLDFERALLRRILLQNVTTATELADLRDPITNWPVMSTTAGRMEDHARKFRWTRLPPAGVLRWLLVAQVVAVVGSAACLLSMLGAQPWPLLDGTAYAFGAALVTASVARTPARRSWLTAEGVQVRGLVRAHVTALRSGGDTGVHDPGLRVAFGLSGLNPQLAEFAAAAVATLPSRGPKRRRGDNSLGYTGGSFDSSGSSSGSSSSSSSSGDGGSSGGGGSW